MRVGILSFAHTHAATYARLLRDRPGIELITTDPGDHDPAEVRGAALAARLDVPYAPDVAALLAARPDAVIVTAENVRHRGLVERAAAAGAAILCEKPLATTWADGLAIRRAVARARVPLMTAFPVRFSPDFQALVGLHRSGSLGELVAVRGANNGMLPTERSWFTDPALSGGGALVDHVVHIADLIDALTGAAPVSVTAIANRVLSADRAAAETAGLVTVRYDSGLIAAIDCSWSVPDTAPVWGGLTFGVAGTGGAVDLDLFGAAARGLDAATGLPRVVRYGPDLDEAMLTAFLDAVSTGAPPEPSVEAGLTTLSIVLAAQRSLATGRTVPIADVTRSDPTDTDPPDTGPRTGRTVTDPPVADASDSVPPGRA